MANTKSKKTNKKKSSNKPKSTSSAKTEKVEEVKLDKATTKAEDTEVETVDTEDTNEIVEEVEEVAVVEVKDVEDTTTDDDKNAKKDKPFAGFFARKGDPNENILTIFKSHKIYGALLGEVIGTMLLTTIFLTLGLYQPLYILFGIMAITIAVMGMSGAHLNPIITAGMMATRRVSAIRGVLYIIAQVLGAWLALMLVNAFASGSESATLPTMAKIEDGKFWTVTLIEFTGASILGFFFARALAYKRSALTFAAVVGGGAVVAILFAIVISSNFLGLQNNFILNPAAAIMYQILPTSGDNFGQLLGDIALALATYVIFPMLGGIIGFTIADVSARLSGANKCCHGNECCKKPAKKD
ncbi:aquaporin [Candidatus Saccharibacteria bacterium]|nr:aquaporin [Candidatus Saccharibacteria bacterium]